ncbi:MAG TPA: MSMEG_0567/Sll0786 family nitrogen starvation N-acetyltransferase [Polyangiaceae bacterium]|nr:MSMEG_0567/Sll0786 family nitrogen starvation N-acetyltransferase [Polyangiaceae bacterium]
MILEAVQPFRCADIGFKLATEAWELDAYHALRRRIFCAEQGIFAEDDRDAIDERATPIVALARMAGVSEEVAGVVRIWEEEPGEWFGGRLGTDREHRKNGNIGPGLIRLAVRTACRRGCARFRATVQQRNVKLFERLGWSVTDEVVLFGIPHARMQAELSRFTGAAS